MDLLTIQSRMGQIVEEQRALNDKTGLNEWQSEDRAKYEALDGEYTRLEKRVEELKKAEQREAAMASVEFKAKEVADKVQDGTANAEERSLRNFLMDPRQFMAEQRAAQASGTAADGGYTIPTTLANEIDKALKDFGGIDAVARFIPTATGENFDWVTVDDTANEGSIKAENVDKGSGTKAAFGKKTFSNYEVTSGVIQLPFTLVRDSSFNLTSLVGELIAERVVRKRSAFLITGTGSSEPEGAVVGASAGTTAAATALTADNILDLVHSVNRAYRKSPSFALVFNDQTQKYVRKLKDSNGQYIWQMGDITKGTPTTLWGVPVIIDDEVADIGASAISMIAGDFRKFLVRRVGQGRMRSSDHRYFEYDQTAIIYSEYIDSKVINSAAIKKLTHATS